eukprot:TRINITY_DN7078_c0_g1_i2.p1 TRINITY_DN7078_c0_g1~~TRINITY_DN7078_c0_g1_i2.p1  ORF type:complete len:672 (+),score=200.49 TRINITY_DN7078_c0_g1_i2:27-2018(+)
MSRHRNLRNLEHEDYSDDYDEEEEDDYEEDDYNKIDQTIDEVWDTLGDGTPFTEDDLVYALRQTKYDPAAAVAWLLEDDQVSSKQKQAFKRDSIPAKPAAKGKKEAPLQGDINIVAMSIQRPKPGKAKASAKPSAKPGAKSAPSKSAPGKAPAKAAGSAASSSSSSSSTPSSSTTVNKLEDDIDAMHLGVSEGSSVSREEEPIKTAPKGVKQHSVSRKKEIEEKIHGAVSGKERLSLVVIGHVDAGKSTTMGHLLYDLGYVDPKIMRKYEHESQRIGKGSFSYAWVLDEHEEERSRGVTIDVGVNYFETEHRRITLLDAPGHRDFVPNMISGATQADVAVLVVGAVSGEFEAGFGSEGQTKEHALLARSLGVQQLIVAVNKMDVTGWNKDRFDEIVGVLTPFLKQVGFSPASVWYVPISGLTGENLVKVTDARLSSWYDGPTLAGRIDAFEPAERLLAKPFRMAVSDVFRGLQMGGIGVAGKIEAGFVAVGDKLLIEPVNEVCTVKSIRADSEQVEFAKAGDNVDLGLGDVEVTHVNPGDILCDPHRPCPIARSFRAQIITFAQLPLPITAGHQIIVYTHHLSEAATITKLHSILDRTTGEVKKKRPRALGENMAAQVDIVLQRPICVERYSNYKQLGRFMVRDQGRSIAAGIIEKLTDPSSA